MPDQPTAPGQPIAPDQLTVPDGRWSRHLPPGATFDPASLAGTSSFTEPWARLWEADPGFPALFLPPKDPSAGTAADAGRWWTAGELDEATRLAAGRLRLLGVEPLDRVVWSTATSASSVVACLAVLRLGAVLVPVNPAYTERELAHVVADVRPRLAVVDRAEQAAWVASTSAGAAVVDSGLGLFDGVGVGRGERGSGVPDPPHEPALHGDLLLDAAAPGDPALVVYTSGTTGVPKGAVLSHANLAAGTAALALAWRWTPEDRLVLALPLFHVHGLCAGLLGTLAAGASAVVLPRFDPSAVLDEAASHGGTMFFGVPTMYHRLLGSGRIGELARLRLCVSGSAPLPPALWEGAHQAGVDVLERYGMSETLLTVSNPFDGERRPGTVGFPLPGVDACLAAPSGMGTETVSCGPGAEGELFVRGPSVFSGYWERPAATEAAFVDGWFRTGDAVAVDDDGYLCVRGRRSDLIISGGFNVYPAEVEDVLLGHPSVAEVAVAGTPSDEWGEEVTAWVVPSGAPPRPEELVAFCAARLAGYKRPRRVRFVDALPRNAMGKVLRSELR